jgi:glucosamine--fructose-6-phosphate aminotransferase (isomerizing)
VDYASEYRYRNPVILPDTLFIFITQSGETLDTIAAQRQLRDNGKSLTITNVVGSMTTRVADAVLYTRAGPEIGVASTKRSRPACLPVSRSAASGAGCTNNDDPKFERR